MSAKRSTRAKRQKLDSKYVADYMDEISVSSGQDPDDLEEARKSKIRESNKEHNRRMTILDSWAGHWSDYTTRQDEAYPQQEARAIFKKTKSIKCPIPSCGKAFKSIGGLNYHYKRCNIVRSFKCKVCAPPTVAFSNRGELLKHMILNHVKDLPSLNEDQMTIVNSYLSCETRSDKPRKERKINVDSEAPSTGITLLKAFQDLRYKAFCSEQYQNRPYKDWRLLAADWELLTIETDRSRYYPPESESAQMRLDNTSLDWSALLIGESAVLNRDKYNSPLTNIFYTGGINTASAWLPKPLYDRETAQTPDLVAIAVNCCSLDQNQSYSESHSGDGCIQFWSIDPHATGDDGSPISTLRFMVGHSYGTIWDMVWCPLGTSWQPPIDTGDVMSRVGLLALACGDGFVRILSVPHPNNLTMRSTTGGMTNVYAVHNYSNRSMTHPTLDKTPIYVAKPVATLMPPGVGPSTNYQPPVCRSMSWNLKDNQRLIAAGYANGYVAIFDLANCSPMLYSSLDGRHVYQPWKSWIAHGSPVTAVALKSDSLEQTLVATGSLDRFLKTWNILDFKTHLTAERAPITKIAWDYRFRGVITATDTAFTSFLNRVSYRYPTVDGNTTSTITAHRATVWGLSSSLVTSAIATSDGAGEVFVVPQMISRSSHRRDRTMLSTHSFYTMLPRMLSADKVRERMSHSQVQQHQATGIHDPLINGFQHHEALVDSHEIQCVDNNSLHNMHELNGGTIVEVRDEEIEDDACAEGEADFSHERQIANKPTNFVLPLEHEPIETYNDFKMRFGLEYANYNCLTTRGDAKLPESCMRASDPQNIYCDRPCDYPFSAVNLIEWSPNVDTYAYLLSATQIGVCRLDRVQIVEQIHQHSVEQIKTSTTMQQSAAPAPSNQQQQQQQTNARQKRSDKQ